MPDVEARRPLNIYALLVPFSIYIVAIYYANNARLFRYRNFFTPLAIFTIWELCTNYAIQDPRLNCWNFFLGCGGFCIAMRLVDIATLREPLTRKSERVCPRTSLFSFRQIWDAIDYSIDLRGLSWNYGRDCRLPPEPRNVKSLFNFEVGTFGLLLKHALLCDILFTAITQFGTLGTPSGGTIFIWTHIPLPLLRAIPIPKLITALSVSTFTGLAAYHTLSAIHFCLTFFAAPFYSNPAQSWPPLFGNPLHATSVSNFWSCQWHSVLRRGFCVTGGELGWKLGDNIGAVLGVFLVSGLLHDAGLWCMGRGMELSRVTSYFVLQGIIVVLEKTIDLNVWLETTNINEDSQKITLRASLAGYPKKPDYLRQCTNLNQYLSKVWTAFWIVVPATFMVDAWARHGLLFFLHATYGLLPFNPSPSRLVLRLLGVHVL